MSRDNVTPFRPRRPPPKPKGGGFNVNSHRGKAVLVQFLTLAAFALNVIFGAPPLSWLALAVAIGAVAIAASNRQDAMPWAQTHHEHALRTLLIGYVISTLARVIWEFVIRPLPLLSPQTTTYLALGFFGIQILVLLWVLIRAGVGLVLAILRKPIWHPRGWLL